VVNDAIPAEVWSRLESRLGSVLDDHAAQVLAGVSTPDLSGVAVKLLARTAPDLTGVLDPLWAAVRAELWSLPPVAWRKY
jgi:urease accessory protein